MESLLKQLIEENLQTQHSTLDLGPGSLIYDDDALELLEQCNHLHTLIFTSIMWREYDQGQKTYEYKYGQSIPQNAFPNVLKQVPNCLPASLKTLVLAGYIDGGGLISDITALAKLSQLQQLHLNDNQVTDIRSLSKLRHLHYLDLNDNKVEDLQALAQCSQLQFLDLSVNHVQEVTPLAKLTHLWFLDVGRNQIEDITALSGLTRLQELDLGKNQIEDITPLAHLTQLVHLRLSQNQIKDVHTLAKLKALKWLQLSNNFIEDVSPLAELKQLEVLYLFENPLQDISCLKHLTQLTELHVYLDDLIYPPIWFALLKTKEGRVGDYAHLPELPQVEKIWQLIKSRQKENIDLAWQVALGQGWTAAEFETYLQLLDQLTQTLK
ncbi:hypothetical protein BKI52_22840 [marine bacterium AO1-C]|nr:hypothetical protein BKI52_22840 [marine bacterium AO1-C]